jgi:hypothetical protein
MKMKALAKRLIRQIVNQYGFDFVRRIPNEFDDGIHYIWHIVKPYTMTTFEQMAALIQATRYVIRENIPGQIVECGVWCGGAMMAAALAIMEMGSRDRQLYLFDTFNGMTEPSAVDIDYKGTLATAIWKSKKRNSGSAWCFSPIEDVKHHLCSIGYPAHQMHFVKGDIMDTVPGQAPYEIALLRLDTDWYRSTLHELIHLYPRVSDGGVVIIDDYGYWRGCKQAVDDYFHMFRRSPILLNRIDHSGRIGVKSGIVYP